jgi:Ca2+:H+ antiporter
VHAMPSSRTRPLTVSSRLGPSGTVSAECCRTPLAVRPRFLALAYLLRVAPVWIFISAIIAVAVLADWVRRATEHLSNRAGSTIGGLLNVSFGSIAELVLSLFVLLQGDVAVVKAQITGSIIGTSLLGLGAAMFAGGLSRTRQSFDRASVGLLSTLLFLVVIALLLPAVFDVTERRLPLGAALADERLSIAVSGVLLFLYLANLIFTLVTHSDIFVGDEPRESSGWSVARSLVVLVIGTALIAVEAELVSGALTDTAGALGLSPIFLGVIILALVGTSADLFAAVVFARQDRMTVVFNICIGSAIQVALIVAPALVLLSWLLGSPMDLVFGSPLDLFAIAGTAFIVRAIAADGETNWFEGLLLVGIYTLLGFGFFFAAPG